MISNRRKNISPEKDDNYDDWRPFPLFAILICGFIIMLAGCYLVVTDGFARGVSLPGRYGRGGGQNIVLSGPVIIIIGFGMCIFPGYQLLKRKLKK